MSTLIQLRRGTAAAWASANPVLHAGEAGVELDTGPRAKFGDGVTAWASLPYLDAYVFTGGDQGALAMRDTGSANGYSWLPSAAGVLVSDGDDEIPVFRPLLAADIPQLAYTSLSGLPTLGDSAALNVGTGAGTVAAGDHLHAGVYEPAFATLGVAKGGTGTATAFTPGSIVFAGASGVYAQDNAGLFYDDANNRVGIGTPTPIAHLQAVDTSSGGALRGIFSSQVSTNTTGPRFVASKARGVTGALTTIVSGDTLGSLSFYGYDGSNYMSAASITAVSTGTIAGTRVPGKLTFLTGTNATPSVVTERMCITETGNVGIGTTLPLNALVVGGSQTGNAGMEVVVTSGVVLQAFNRTAGAYATMNFDGASINFRPSSVQALTIQAGGICGFGVGAPTAIVHIKAGTAAAGTAPFKLTSGPVLTAPEPGAVEFLTDAFYGTITTGSARRTFAMLESAQSWSGLQTFAGGVSMGGAMVTTVDGIAVTATDGLVLQNTTAATSGVPVQQSPDLRLRSHVWNTSGTPADNSNDWIIRSVPVSGAAPSGLLKFGKSLNGGATTFPMTLDSAGALTIGSYFEGTEIATPAAPAANGARLYFDDNGAGKTRLMVIFATGAAQQVAIQP